MPLISAQLQYIAACRDRILRVVTYQQHRQMRRGLEDERPEPVAQRHVQLGKGLVQQQRLGLGQQDAEQCNPGAFTAGKRQRVAVRETGKFYARQRLLRSIDAERLFDVRVDGVVAAERKLPGKPHPDTFLAAAGDLGVEAARAAVFEDALAGMDAGRSGRFGYVVGVDRAGQADALYAHGADVVVKDLAELGSRA